MEHEQREYKTYAEKMRRADKEALYTMVALAVIVIAWIVGGIGLSGLDVEVASTPVWIIGGTVGPWLVAVVIAIVFAKRVFANFSLDDEETAIPNHDEKNDIGTAPLSRDEAGDVQ